MRPDSTRPDSTDRIERSVLLRVPPARVWRALTDEHEFGAWFGVDVEGRFGPGARLTGRITHPGYEHLVWRITVVRMEPERLFSWRWHPYGIDPDVDYSKEEPTLVTFTLEEVPEGTRLTVVESGFDLVPLSRRAQAYRMNSEGWSAQVRNLEAHVS
jgi:uncharacterized protein YndB with AHSA1/START domain